MRGPALYAYRAALPDRDAGRYQYLLEKNLAMLCSISQDHEENEILEKIKALGVMEMH